MPTLLAVLGGPSHFFILPELKYQAEPLDKASQIFDHFSWRIVQISQRGDI